MHNKNAYVGTQVATRNASTWYSRLKMQQIT